MDTFSLAKGHLRTVLNLTSRKTPLIMNKITKVLVPFDFSPVSENALQYAIHLIKREPTKEVQLLHVTEDTPSKTQQEDMDARIQAIIERYRSQTDAQLSATFATGTLSPEIIAAQKRLGADVIIMGTIGSSDPEGEEATNSAQLVLEADCPVIVVPAGSEHFDVKKIALAIGKNEVDDPNALDVLLVIARNFDAKIHVLTIYDEGDPDVYASTPNEEALRYHLERYYDRDAFVISSNIMDAIFDYVKEHDIDMLAIIPRNHAKQQPSSGRLTKLVALQTSVPLLAID